MEKTYSGPNRRKKDRHIEELLEAAASRAIEKAQPGQVGHECRFPHITPEEHDRHHRMCESAIEFLDRLNNTKWGVFTAVMIFLALGCLGALGIGLTAKFGGHH